MSGVVLVQLCRKTTTRLAALFLPGLVARLKFVHRGLNLIAVLMRIALHHLEGLGATHPFHGGQVHPGLHQVGSGGISKGMVKNLLDTCQTEVVCRRIAEAERRWG